MAEMGLIGPERRGRDLRNAANRYRTEVDYALGRLLGAPATTRRSADETRQSLHDLAETMGILRAVMTALDEEFPVGDPRREIVLGQLGSDLRWAETYHEVAR